MTTRRDFLVASGALGAGLALSACRSKTPSSEEPRVDVRPSLAATASAPPAPRGESQGLLSRAIPSSGERLPVIGAGTSGSYEVPLGSAEFSALTQAVQIFFTGGGRVIDTSPNYGNAEDVLGELLARGGYRNRCFLATKLAADSREALEAQWAASLRRLKTNKVELLQVHNLRNLAEALPYARELQRRGLVRYVGITHYLESAHEALLRVMRRDKPDFVQVNYSVSAPQAKRSLFPAAQDLGIAVLVNRTFDDGKLFAKVAGKPLPGWASSLGISSWAQMFLKFALSHPAVTAVIPATGKPKHQADNLRAGTGPLLDEEHQKELITMFT